MTCLLRAVATALGAAVFLNGLAQAQVTRSSGTKVVTKTLVRSEAQKECISLAAEQRLYYRFRADGALDFKLSHQDEHEVIDLKRDRAAHAAGSFTPTKQANYCMVWSNTGRVPVTLHYEFQRGGR
jgi:hypothetical protein